MPTPSPSPTRIRVPIDAQDPAAWMLAVQIADGLAKQDADAREIILLTHTKGQLSGTSLGNFVGKAAAKALLANKTVPLPQFGKPLRHATLQTIGGFARGAILIAYYAEDRMLDAVDGITGLAAVIAVPEFDDQVEGWEARWNPIVPGQAAKPAKSLLSDPVVEKALTTLTSLINLGNGVLVARDKDKVDEILRILRNKGHALDAAAIKSWAIQQGWKNGAADELAKLAVRIGSLKTKPSISGFYDPETRYARWAT